MKTFFLFTLHLPCVLLTLALAISEMVFTMVISFLICLFELILLAAMVAVAVTSFGLLLSLLA